MKTIFYEQNKLHISDKQHPEFGHIFIEPNTLNIKFIVDLFLNSKQYEGLIVGDKAKIFKQIKRQFKHIKAAGGVVLNTKSEVLLIKRLGKWDLPKGKMEANETKRICAVREVEEECGIHGLKIRKKLKSSYHVYPYNGSWALKTSYWYLMDYVGTETLVPQAEEGITHAEWVSMKEFDEKEYETYPAIAKVLHQSRFLLE
jgi:8-oxo-dGTP pyrophosphatase MutT (NUDIX family)